MLITDAGGRLAGIFTERDALGILAGDCDLSQPIEQVMVKNPDTVKSSDTVATVIRRMSEHKHRRIPIVDDDGRPTGIVKTSWGSCTTWRAALSADGLQPAAEFQPGDRREGRSVRRTEE